MGYADSHYVPTPQAPASYLSLCRAVCGASEVNWQTAPDSVAPAGWKISDGLTHNVGNQRLCAGGWNAYAGGRAIGTLSTKLKGYGTVTIKYRDCWKEGSATVYLNGQQKGQTSGKTGALETTT